jgi:hypothetical protein
MYAVLCDFVVFIGTAVPYEKQDEALQSHVSLLQTPE